VQVESKNKRHANGSKSNELKGNEGLNSDEKEGIETTIIQPQIPIFNPSKRQKIGL